MRDRKFTSRLTLEDLKEELGELSASYPAFHDEDLFVLWFLRAYLTDDVKAAAEAVTNGTKDKGIDAVLIDNAARAIFLVQSKYRRSIGDKMESRADVIGFAQIGGLVGDQGSEAFKDFLRGTDPHLEERLALARKHICNHKYRLWMYYITLGRCSSALSLEADKMVHKAPYDADLTVLDGVRIMTLLRDYLDGVAPPIPTLDLEMEKGLGVEVTGIMQRYEGASDIESWVFSMRGDAVAALFDIGHARLFARNIRGFLGEDTAVNRSMEGTLQREPDRFFYYNNGITILCDEAEKRSAKGKEFLRVSNPQVINGQQTTRMLARMAEDARKASVLVKVIKVPRDLEDIGFDELVSRIVAGTNWQNAIRPSDLMSNDRKQIELERGLRKLGYVYIRKRQNKSEARNVAGGKHFHPLKKEELATAVAGCDLDPVEARSGKQNLFKEDRYSQVFPNVDPDYYLPRYWLMKQVGSCSRGRPERAYAKWLVLGFTWSKLAPLLRTVKEKRAFRHACERKDQRLLRPLHRAIGRAFVAALKYYRRNRGGGEQAVDVSTFFRNKHGRHKGFKQYWDSPDNRARRPFEKAWEAAGSAIGALTLDI